MVFLVGALAVGAVKTFIIAPNTVTDPEEILERFYAARQSLPPIPSPVDYKTVVDQLSEDRFDFISDPDWAFLHDDGTLYLSDQSKLKLELPMRLVAYEDLMSGKVVLTGTSINSGEIQTLAMVEAPEFSVFEEKTSLDSYLMNEIWPRRIIWTASLKTEDDAWSDLLSTQEQAFVEPLMMTMSLPETITDFRLIQNGTNNLDLSVNLPVEFVGANLELLKCSNLVDAVWSSVLQTNAASTGLLFLCSAEIPDLPTGGSSTNGGGEIPMPDGTNTTSSAGTNQNVAVFYKIDASSSVDTDNDALGNLAEYELGTDYQDSDSDDDGMPDGYEVSYGFDPLLFIDGSTDLDSDNLVNSNEYLQRTLPNDPDTDNDGLPDGWEVQNGFNPLDPFDATEDADHDGFIAAYEYAHSTDLNDQSSAPSPTRYVSLAGSHTAPYSTPSTAATNIQAALDAATNDFEIISLAAGTYNGIGNHELLFPTNPVMLFSEASPSDCVIECKTLIGGLFYRGSAFSCSNVMDGFTVLKNLKIEDGYANVPLNCSNSKLLISNCLIADHVGVNGAPAFSVNSNAFLVMRDSIVSYFETSEDSSRIFIFANSSDIKMERCEILHNYVGVQLTEASSLKGYATRMKCIASNKTHSAGVKIGSDCEVSGLLLEEGAAGVDCLIYPESALIRNCVMLNNDKGISGWWLNNNLEVQHCTILDNNIGIQGPSAIVQNVILWGNSQQASDSNLVISSSCVQGGWSGTGNITNNPLIELDYNIASNSPCLNAGTTNAAFGSDIDGYERDSLPDIGAAEYVDLSADSDGDGLPDWWELRYGLDATSTNGINGASGDFDGDGLDNSYEYSLQSSPSYPNSVQAAFPSVETRSTEVDMPKFGWEDFDPDDPLNLYLKKTGLYERDYEFSRNDSIGWANVSEEIFRSEVMEYSRGGSLTTNYSGFYTQSIVGLQYGDENEDTTWEITTTGSCQSDGRFLVTESGWVDFANDGMGKVYQTNTFYISVTPPAVTITNSPIERSSGIVGDDLYTETLSIEHTTELMCSNALTLVSVSVAKPWSPGPLGSWGEGRYWSFEDYDWAVTSAAQTAVYDLATNETSILVRKVHYHFVFQGDPGVVYQITPYKLFTPEDGSAPQLTQLSAITVLGTGEEQIVEGHDITVDPPATDGTIEVVTLKVNLTAYRPMTEGPGYGAPFMQHEVPDDLEESPGAGIRVNGDSDASADENDLIEVQMEAYSGSSVSDIFYVLRRSNSNIKVWNDRQMTSALLDSGTEVAISAENFTRSVWVESPNGGTADLELIAQDSSGKDLVFDKIHFYPFTSVIVLFEGEFGDPADPPQTGISQLALDIYQNGYDVHLYNEPDAGDPDTEIDAFNEIENAAQNRQVSSVAIIGYSHGGGSTFNVSEALDSDPTAFNLNFTAYIDAVTQDAITQENRRPINSAFHVNYYQEAVLGYPDFSLDGGPIDDPPGADFEVNVDDPIATETHTTIDDNPAVQAGITTRLYQRTNR